MHNAIYAVYYYKVSFAASILMVTDPYFKVTVLSATKNPNLLCSLAMHQCVAESPIDIDSWQSLSETKLGDRLVKHCIKFGHFSVIEHAVISFLVQGFPHDVLVQLSRHRHLSLSVQSQRYTGQRIIDLANSVNESCCNETEKLFYVRPIGEYIDRKGRKFLQTKDSRIEELMDCKKSVIKYSDKIAKNMPFEMARNTLPQSIRQDFVVTMNARSLLHFCDLRLPKDAQPEIRTLAFLIFEYYKQWMPEIAEWYEKNRLGKNKLSP